MLDIDILRSQMKIESLNDGFENLVEEDFQKAYGTFEVLTNEQYNLLNNDIRKSISDELNEDLKEYIIEKANKDLSKLVKKNVWVTRNGQSFKQTVWVRIDTGKEEETPIGEQLSEIVNGLDIVKYSDKAIFIKGDTYANIDTMREIKAATGVGTFTKLGGERGWMFPIKYLDTVLGTIWSKVKDQHPEKADAIQNQKNALPDGTNVTIGDVAGEIKENVSDNTGIKYNVELADGETLNNVDEKVIKTEPLTDDKKIADIINNTQPENRAKTEKQLYGVKPIVDIHKYTLNEYLAMHGISNDDIEKFVASMNKPKSEGGDRKPSSGGGSGGKKSGSEGLSKNQLLRKLFYAHYNAVKAAIESGEKLPKGVVDTYSDLKEMYEKKRTAMSEETKRKISEALRSRGKRKPEGKKEPESIFDDEAKLADAIKKILGENKDLLAEMIAKFSQSSSELETKFQNNLADLLLKKQAANEKLQEIGTKNQYADGVYEEKAKVRNEISSIDKKIRANNNRLLSLKNGGTITHVVDKTGVEHDNVPNFKNISTDNFTFNLDTILTDPRPEYIPEIDTDKFGNKGYILDAIRIDNDTYMVATNGHSEHGAPKGYNRKTNKNEYFDVDFENAGYVVLSLDQLVLTNDYYTSKQRATYQQKANEKNQRELDSWNKMTDARKEYYMNAQHYDGLPSKVQKQVTKTEWNAMNWQEREKIYKPIKKHNAERLKTSLDTEHMWTSFHDMHQRFVDLSAAITDKKTGRAFPLGESTGGNIGHPKAFESWRNFSEMLKWKLNDIAIQREEENQNEQYKQAMETSFGESNTNLSLQDKYGIKVKRQNGEVIKPKEIEELKNAWESVTNTFGTPLKNLAKEDGLKLSHSGEKFIFASKAAGVYVPNRKAIAVTAKYGTDSLGFILGHEVAHWVDHAIGRQTGKRYASNDYESTAGKIAITLKRNMNKKSESSYINSTHEAFARALEMYQAVESKDDKALVFGREHYFDSPVYVNKQVYETQLKPLIQQFLSENKDILKSNLFNFIF